MPEHPYAVRTLVAAASATLLLSACSGDDSDTSDAPAHSSAYEQALDRLPADTPSFEFRDVKGAEDRLGIADEHDPDAYLEGAPEAEWATSSLLPYLETMSDSAWDATDIVWEAQILTAPEAFTVRRLDDDVDLDAAIGELEEAGYTAEDEGDGTMLLAGLGDISSESPGLYVQLGLAVLVLPDEHLIISARDEGALSTYTKMGKSLSEAGGFASLDQDTALDMEYVYAEADSQACSQAAGQAGELATDAQRAALEEQYADLGTPESAALVLGANDDETAAAAQLTFADEEAAEADAEPRNALLRDGTSMVGGAPYSEYFTVEDISVDGAIETIAIDPLDNPGRLPQMVASRDAPFLACGPS